MREAQCHDFNVDRDVKCDHGHEPPLLDVLIEIPTEPTSENDTAELADTVLEHPGIGSCS